MTKASEYTIISFMEDKLILTKEEMYNMRLDGQSYQQIALKANVTRQRVQQVIAPPKATRNYVIAKYSGRCADCGVLVGRSGHIHHDGHTTIEEYTDIKNLVLLCLSCHFRRHSGYVTKDIVRLTCKRCGHEWVPRQESIEICPKCKSARWNEPKPKS